MNEQSPSATPKLPERSLAISLSGGGHRATLFGLGALMYLVDAGANANVTSIASVSGGSLTNGFVGQTLDFRTTDGSSFREQVARPLATQIARKGTLFALLLTKLYLVLLIAGGISVLVVPWALPVPWYAAVLVFLVGLAGWGWLLGKRGLLCARAFEKTLFSANGQATPLSAVRRENIDHVICATELRASQQVFFSGDFVWSYSLGHGRPGDLALARAVQASASFPGGFPAVRLSTAPHQFEGAPVDREGPKGPPSHIVMSDGGVYDNMGDEWARGYGDRVKLWQGLADGRQAPNRLVVVNASARVPWQPFRGGLVPLVGELALLLRVNNVMYINTTNVRRQEIARSFDPDQPDKAGALSSALVQITQSPFRVADRFAKGNGPAADRARAILSMLGDQTRQEWAGIAQHNAKLPTSLSAFGVDDSASLIRQAYVVTMCNLHVIFGGEFPLLPNAVGYQQYRQLIS